MAKKKWYVVIVGKDVGIFETWLETAPLINGVSGALHQSFPTEEEARRVFEDERDKGNTRVVGGRPPIRRGSHLEAPVPEVAEASFPGGSEGHVEIDSPLSPPGQDENLVEI